MVLFWVLDCGHYWILSDNVMKNMQAIGFLNNQDAIWKLWRMFNNVCSY